jgi:hypothetical protein
MKGGTTFHFIDTSPAEALEAAQEAAGGLDVRIGGGPSTIRQFLAADLVDHMPKGAWWAWPSRQKEPTQMQLWSFETNPWS